MQGQELLHRLREILVRESLRRGHFVLASGRTSDYYLDCRRTTLHPEGAYLVGSIVLGVLDHRGWAVDAVGGLTMGADPIATAVSLTSYLQERPVGAFLIRKASKTHGTGQRIEGCPPEGARVVLVEDVITSGGSLLEAHAASVEAGLRVVGGIVVVDREEGGREAIARAGIPLEALFTARELLSR